MNGYWVLLKKSAYTRFPRVPFTSFNKTSCSLWVRKREKKKFNFVPSSLVLTYHYYLILSVKCVCSLFFLSGPVNNNGRMQTWGHVQSCLEIRKCQHIYNIPHFNSKFLSIQVKRRFFLLTHFSFLSFLMLCYIVLKANLNFDLNNEKEKNEDEEEEETKNRQNLLPSKYMYQQSIRMKRAHKTHKSILYLNLQIKNFLSLPHSLIFTSKIY